MRWPSEGTVPNGECNHVSPKRDRRGSFVTAIAAPAAAQAAVGFTTGDVNMRTGPSTGYHRILTIPEGSRVFIHGCSSWCSVRYHGRDGYVSSNYVAARGYNAGPRSYRRPAPPPRPRGGWAHRRPWWDSRHHAWYNGDRWYFGGRWYDRPSGFSFGFGFGG